MCTLLDELVDVALHDQEREIPIENLHGVVEYSILNHFALLVWLDILGVDFSLALHKQLSVLFPDYSSPLILGVRLHAY